MASTNRNVNVNVQLNAGGNLGQQLNAAAGAAAQLNTQLNGQPRFRQQGIRVGLSQQSLGIAAQFQQQAALARLGYLGSNQGRQQQQQLMGLQDQVQGATLRNRTAYLGSQIGQRNQQQILGLTDQQQAAQLRNRNAYLQSAPGQQNQQLLQGLHAQQALIQGEQRLAFVRSSAGQNALMAQSRLQRAIGFQQELLTNQGRYGRVGGALVTANERLQPLFGMARTGAAVGAGAIAAGVASNEFLSQQLAGSFRMLSREIGISVTPQMVRLSGAIQTTARAYRAVNEGTGGAAGTALFGGTAVLGTVAALGFAANQISSGYQALGNVGAWIGSIGQGSQVAQVARGVTPAMARAAPAAIPVAGGTALGGSILAGGGLAAATVAGLYALGELGAVAAPHIRGVVNRLAPSTRDQTTTGGGLLAGFTDALEHPWAQGLARGFGGAAFRQNISGPVEPFFNREAQISSDPMALYNRLTLAAQNRSPVEAEQSAREYREFVTALNDVSTALRERLPARENP